MSGEDNPRRPKNLEGLLKFCLSATQTEDAPDTTQPRQLTQEEREWLNEAMRAAMGNDPVKVMIEHVQLLSNIGQGQASDDNLSRQIEAIEGLQDFCDDIDLARDFQKIGGYALLPWLLRHDSSEVRWRCAELVATLVQNNPYCQKAALELGVMEILLDLLAKDEAEMVRVKALYAVSCLSRECDEAQEELLRHDGLSVMVAALQSDTEKLHTKAAFLIAYLCSTSPKLRDMLTEMGIVEQLVSLLLHAEHAPYHEHLAAALLHVTRDNAAAVRDARRPELQLRALLHQRIQFLAGKEEFMEEEESCQALLQICFTDNEQPDK